MHFFICTSSTSINTLKKHTNKIHNVAKMMFLNTVKTAMGDLCGRRPPTIPDRLLKARMCFQH
jgi:hypothetical protein